MAKPTGSAQKQPNIVFIMGDDIGWFNISADHRGMMAGQTPNLDKMAAEGMLFTDYYAEASCTAGRANFITGQMPIRTGLTTVGQAGATIGMPAEAPTIATALKTMGYATGQFGKNHLGDRNEFLPTVHGFDEFFGYLQQTTGDSGSGAQLGSFKEAQAGVGPVISYAAQFNKVGVAASLKGLPQIGTDNTLKGNYVWAKLGVSF